MNILMEYFSVGLWHVHLWRLVSIRYLRYVDFPSMGATVFIQVQIVTTQSKISLMGVEALLRNILLVRFLLCSIDNPLTLNGFTRGFFSRFPMHLSVHIYGIHTRPLYAK